MFRGFINLNARHSDHEISVFKKTQHILLYYLCFYIMVAIAEFVVFPHYVDANSIKGIFIYEVVSLSIWVISCLCFIKYILKESPLKYLKLNTNAKWGLVNGLKYTLPLMILYSTTALVLGKELSFDFEILKWVGGIILVGITEEPIFRGIILRELMVKHTFLKSNLITSILFLLVHLPKWVIRGYFNTLSVMPMMISVFVISYYFGYVYKKSDSLWSSIIVHTANNLIVSIFR